MQNGDPHDEIVRLEAHIERLAAKIENCRKFALASQVAMIAGAAVLIGTIFGAVTFDAAVMAGAVAAVLGGIVVYGSNGSTAKEAEAELAKAEANRKALIGLIQLRAIPENVTLH
jgi:undecaprenyl pyrophosphate phosphatase UppP